MAPRTVAPIVGPLLARFGLTPAEIEARSLARIEALAGDRLPSDVLERTVATRMLYATGEPTLARQLIISPGACTAGVVALRRGAPLLVDVAMVERGLRQDLLARLGTPVKVAVLAQGAAALARALGTTRAAAGTLLLAGELADGGIAAIGNAPTALLALLDEMAVGRSRPDLVVGCPVGLVAAEESKEALCAGGWPAIAVRGTRGGSPPTAAAVNALLAAAVGETSAAEAGRS
ncbi:MAG: precorrin-8X methylmutase [Chloroflexi bacterium]|nr:precorrin-8X methylmutase [Chloroflexota bacterium]